MSRPKLDPNVLATNANYSDGAWINRPTKHAPSLTLQANGWGSGRSQPTAQEFNFKLNNLDKARTYLDSIEAENFASSGVKYAGLLQGLFFEFDPRAGFLNGPQFTTAIGFNGASAVIVLRSVDQGHVWITSWQSGGTHDSASGADVIDRLSGAYDVSSDGASWLAVARGTVSGNFANVLYRDQASTAYDGTAVKSVFVGTGLVACRWCEAASGYLLGRVSGGNTAMLLVIPSASIGVATVAVASPRAASDPISYIACGATYNIAADSSGYIWRSAASVAGGFLLMSTGGTPDLPGIIALEWVATEAAFFAATYVASAWKFWRSADGALGSWTQTGGFPAQLGGRVGLSAAAGAQTRRDFVVRGSTIHWLYAHAANSGETCYMRAYSNDMGTTWRRLPINMASTDTVPTLRYPSLHAPPTEDRVLITMASAIATDTIASLRLNGS